MFHLKARHPPTDELRLFAAEAATAVDFNFRDVNQRPCAGWTDALETLAAAEHKPLRWELERKAQALPRVSPGLRYALAAREVVEGAGDALTVTAADIFGPAKVLVR